MVRVSQPFSANLGKRLVKSPKVYLRDSGMLHALLNLPGGQLRAVGINYSKASRVGNGFAEALDTLAIESGFVVAPVDSACPMSARAKVLPLSQLAEIWRQ